MNTLRERVAEGAAILDAEYPTWFEQIDRSTLNMGNTSLCVLGQVFGNFNEACERLDISGFDEGFYGDPTGQYQAEQAALQDLWIEVITQRLAAQS